MVANAQSTGVNEMMRKPSFETWNREILDKFAQEAFDLIVKLQDQLSELEYEKEVAKRKYLQKIEQLIEDRDYLITLKGVK